MEWHSGGYVEELAVPRRDEDVFDGLPSDSWFSWGKIVESFNSPKKLNVLGVEEFLLNGTTFDSEVEQSGSPSVRQGSRQAFCQQSAFPHEHSDDQLNDLSTIDEADDIFFHSLFEADASLIEGAEVSANLTYNSLKDDVMSVVDVLGEGDHILDHTKKEPELDICVSEEYSNVNEDISDEDIPMKESALLEFQRLTDQLAKKTRICFRDSLYRLAENSRHQSKCTQNGNKDLQKCKHTTSCGQSRFQESKAKRLETNAIDRTVATLLFNGTKCGNPAAPSASCLASGMPLGEYCAKPLLNHPNSPFSSLCIILGGDAEVPTFVG